jgi:hypothetical protein
MADIFDYILYYNMNLYIEGLKILFLFIGLFYSSVNISRLVIRQNIPASNYFLMTVGWTGLIYLVWIK